jgi:hypothetical protein
LEKPAENIRAKLKRQFEKITILDCIASCGIILAICWLEIEKLKEQSNIQVVKKL